MKRDIDLIRKLLLHFEGKSNDQMEKTVEVDGYTEIEVNYHLLLMYEADFLRCEREVTNAERTIRVYPFSLTWEGHEYLDAMRDEGIWQSVKSKVGSRVGAVPFDVLKALLTQAAKDALLGPGS